MRSGKWIGFGIGALLAVACANEDRAEPVSAGRCGPHGVLHGGAGVPPHCDCDPGFVDIDDYCRPVEDHPEAFLLPTTCFAGTSPCEPRTGEGCASGETCELEATDRLICYPRPDAAGIGEPCDEAGGPHCASGGWCALDEDGMSTCRIVCCADSDCTEVGETCVGLFRDARLGTLGVCRPPAGAGGM